MQLEKRVISNPPYGISSQSRTVAMLHSTGPLPNPTGIPAPEQNNRPNYSGILSLSVTVPKGRERAIGDVSLVCSLPLGHLALATVQRQDTGLEGCLA